MVVCDSQRISVPATLQVRDLSEFESDERWTFRARLGILPDDADWEAVIKARSKLSAVKTKPGIGPKVRTLFSLLSNAELSDRYTFFFFFQMSFREHDRWVASVSFTARSVGLVLLILIASFSFYRAFDVAWW